MDPKLAEIYGTNQASEADIEKLAAAELAEELSENDEADIDGMSDEQIEALAEQVLAGEEQEESADEEPTDEESMEKISEADYLGRVMAHSYVQELRTIDAEMEKEAAKKKAPAKAPGKMRAAAGKVMAAIRANPKKSIGAGAGLLAAGGGLAAYRHHKKKKESGAEYGEAEKSEQKRTARGAGRVVGLGGAAVGGALGAASGRTVAGKIGKGLAGALAGGGLSYGGSYGGTRALSRVARAVGQVGEKEKAKESSALDLLAEQRALEILAENGIDPTAEYEKTAGSEAEVLAEAVEMRAFAMLDQAGYIDEE